MTTEPEIDELTRYLDSLERESCYRVDETLKESEHEVTQKVSFMGQNGAVGQPLIRKFIQRDSGLGGVYERLFAAFQAGQRFKHIPDIHECYYHDDKLVVVMEYVHGETLQDYLRRNGPSAELAHDVFPRLCDAASELHDEFDPPIIHRDLKPSNVILSSRGLAIIDFGIAREYREGSSEDTSHFGTRAFAPPEQFGFGQTTIRSDIYALGMLLFFCLTERIPNAALSEDDLNDPRITPAMKDVVRQATAFDPANRFGSASALKEAYRAARQQDDAGETDRHPDFNPSDLQPAIAGTPREPRHEASISEGTAVEHGAAGSAGAAAAHGAGISAGAAASTRATAEHEAPNVHGAATASEAPVTHEGAAMKTTLAGKARNCIIAFFLAIFLVACVSLFLDPSRYAAGNTSVGFNAFGYLFAMPLICCVTAVLLADKTWIKQKIPQLRKYKMRHWILAYLAFWAVIFVLFGIAEVIWPPPQ